MEKPTNEYTLKRTRTHSYLKEACSSKRSLAILTNISKLSPNYHPNRLSNLQTPISPQTSTTGRLPVTAKRARIKRLIAELYFKKVQGQFERNLPIGIPECQTRAVRPVRDFTITRLERGIVQTAMPLKPIGKIKPQGFGYVVGQRKNILDKSAALKKRFIRIRMPSKPHFDVGVSTTVHRNTSDIQLPFDSPTRRSSESQDRTKLDDVLGYIRSETKLPKRKVIYQSDSLNQWGNDISSYYSFC